jgi:hypothetical protein
MHILLCRSMLQCSLASQFTEEQQVHSLWISSPQASEGKQVTSFTCCEQGAGVCVISPKNQTPGLGDVDSSIVQMVWGSDQHRSSDDWGYPRRHKTGDVLYQILLKSCIDNPGSQEIWSLESRLDDLVRSQESKEAEDRVFKRLMDCSIAALSRTCDERQKNREVKESPGCGAGRQDA